MMKHFYWKYILLWCMILGQYPLFAQHLPINFIPNEGQWEEDFLYKGVSSFADIYLEKNGMTFVIGAAENQEKKHVFKERIVPEDSIVYLDFHSYKMKWINANPNPQTIPSKKQSFYHNYYLGNDSSRWKSEVGIFRNVDFKEIYSNIDLHISSSEGNVKYDFIVKPYGDPQEIRFKYEGLDRVILKDGELILSTSVGEIIETKPYAFQYIDGELVEILCEYLLSANGEVYFNFPDGYEKSVNLIIDPVIVFASLTGSTADNWGFTATYDDDGNLYAGGIANALGYPTSTGAFQITYGGGHSTSSMPCDITISKFNANGTNLIYSTYIGGNGDDMPHSLIVDDNDNLLISGKTNSSNYPTTASAFQPTHNGGYDILLSKLNANGTAMLASTYLGGSADDGVHVSISYYADQNTLKYNYGDGSRSEIIIDKFSNIYLAGSTHSSNFPTTSNAAKSNLGGNQDGIFVKFNPTLTNLLYGTYIGGNQDDAAYVIALDTAEDKVFVSGGTSSPNFHNSIMNGYQSTYQGGLSDGYILRFANSGNYPLEGGTFIGTSNYDQCYGLEIDEENGIYVMGQTLGNFPVSPGVYSNPGSPQFLMKLDANLSTSIYSTVFGSGPSAQPNISPVAFLVDTCQNVYISGWASPAISPGSSTSGMPITSNAFQSITDNADFYFIVLSRDANNLLFGSFFGSPGKSEHVDGGTSRFDPQGVVYQSICASCGAGSAYPSTPGVYASSKGSNNCNLGVVKIAFNLGSVQAKIDADPVNGCAPLTVNFNNNSSNATSYEWHFNDGSPISNAVNPSHQFQNTGLYNVMLIAINPDACKTRDTTYVEINISDQEVSADFNFDLNDVCDNPNITIRNLSQARPGNSLNSANYDWYFGDGSSYNGINPPIHYYNNTGSYDLMLIMTDTAACNSPDTIIKTVDIKQEYVLAEFTPQSPICLGDSISFNNTSQNGREFTWNFGNGASSSEEHPIYQFNSVGKYTIKLLVGNPSSCNLLDSAIHEIEVLPNPTAHFNFSPNPPELNTPVTFQNQSQDATSYQWTFGDGKSSNEKDPIHNYTENGEFTVCLTAINDAGCEDKICRTLRAEVSSIAGLPTGFSPNGDGENDILYVRGYNIEKIHLKIFNRWGELVFESTDINHGWDGTYNGKPQEMEVYAYTLELTFLDGKKEFKKGNITLLR